ncbi:ABC transporter permease [Mangrovivirga sp. M17]|uniref:ABC transporter permease n=1 Tax=Mangrovivirga halotolerans TaxID=2993936 RepID=A0ABT3RMG1_9BACT|nr:ABC transporter permease [Mangrovivirga halotolerans]MCX2742924.1 ABC transporter permease [Mangrovivirga halotolerans]
MNKILLVIRREYLTRVTNKTFILMTFLTPLLIVGVYALIIFLSVKGVEDQKKIIVLDKSEKFEKALVSSDNLEFEFLPESLSGDLAKESYLDSKAYGLLYIPDFKGDNPKDVVLRTKGNPGIGTLTVIESMLEDEIERLKLQKKGLSTDIFDEINSDIDITTINLSEDGTEKKTSALVGTIAGGASAYMIFIFIMIYGSQVMRGVVEEKSGKIVEVIVSSVKPFQLMAGKIIGIAAVGLTQLFMWVVLTVILLVVASAFIGQTEVVNTAMESQQQLDNFNQGGAPSEFQVNVITEVISSLNLPLIVACFIFYFLGGFLIYASLFAMIGSVVDSETDTQQFMFPVILPIIISIGVGLPAVESPNGTLATVFSMIPLTSPVVMMARLPFDIPAWQIIVSMVLLILGIIGTAWLAGRVYRIGILTRGAKVSYKLIFKWMIKNY